MKFKFFTQNNISQTILAFLISCYIKFVKISSNNNYINTDEINKYVSKKNVIFVFWHGRELMLTRYLSLLVKRKNKEKFTIYSVTSSHKDGNLVAKVLKYFNSVILRGSSNKKATELLRNILKSLKKPNSYLCIVPDGPRGPSMKIAGAVVDIARMSEAVIIPVTYSAKNAKILNSWDSFMVPSIFNDLTVSFGDAISVPKKLSDSQKKIIERKIEDNLNKMTWELDKKYGREKIIPGKENKKRNAKTI